MRSITQAIRDSERRHRGEIRFAVESSLPLGRLLSGQSARARAIELFSLLQTWDTEQNNGVLVYLLLADRDIEIVVDRDIGRRVPATRWQAICREMEATFREGEFEAGCIAGIRAIGAELERQYPGVDHHGNELPDEPAVID